MIVFATNVAVIMPPDGADAAATTAVPSGDKAEMPRWDLNARFGFDSPFATAIDEHMEETKKRAVAFKETYEGKLLEDGTSLLAAIAEMEEIAARKSLVSSYLSLSLDVALNDDALKKRRGALSQLSSEITGNYLEWFELDVARMTEPEMQGQFHKEPGLQKYASYLEEVRRQRPHNLEKNVERALTVRSPYSGTRPLVSFFDKELSLMRFSFDDSNDGNGETVNMEVLLSRLSSSKDASVRAKCLQLLNDGLGGAVSRVAALSLSSVAGSWLIENKERHYQDLRSRRNLDNNCDDATIDSLLAGVRTAGVPLCKRYYAMKKEILKQTQGLEVFRWSDRNAPMDISTKNKDSKEEEKKEEKISWDVAVKMVERGYHKFSPRMASLFMDMVNEKRIDVPATDGKKGGAYCGMCFL